MHPQVQLYSKELITIQDITISSLFLKRGVYSGNYSNLCCIFVSGCMPCTLYIIASAAIHVAILNFDIRIIIIAS